MLKLRQCPEGPCGWSVGTEHAFVNTARCSLAWLGLRGHAGPRAGSHACVLTSQRHVMNTLSQGFRRGRGGAGWGAGVSSGLKHAVAPSQPHGGGCARGSQVHRRDERHREARGPWPGRRVLKRRESYYHVTPLLGLGRRHTHGSELSAPPCSWQGCSQQSRLGTAPVSADRRAERGDGVHVRSGTLLSRKEERNLAVGKHGVGLGGIMLREISQRCDFTDR